MVQLCTNNVLGLKNEKSRWIQLEHLPQKVANFGMTSADKHNSFRQKFGDVKSMFIFNKFCCDSRKKVEFTISCIC